MKQRAQHLSATHEIVTADSDTNLICFTIGTKSIYAINASHAVEIIDNAVITSIPNCSNIISGVVNWRGLLIMVANLSKLLNIPDVVLTDNRKMVVVQLDKHTFALEADQIIGGLEINLHNCIVDEDTTEEHRFIDCTANNNITLLSIRAIYNNIITSTLNMEITP